MMILSFISAASADVLGEANPAGIQDVFDGFDVLEEDTDSK